MNPVFASLMPSFIVDDLRNSPAIACNLSRESEHKESRLSFVQSFPVITIVNLHPEING